MGDGDPLSELYAQPSRDAARRAATQLAAVVARAEVCLRGEVVGELLDFALSSDDAEIRRSLLVAIAGLNDDDLSADWVEDAREALEVEGIEAPVSSLRRQRRLRAQARGPAALLRLALGGELRLLEGTCGAQRRDRARTLCARFEELSKLDGLSAKERRLVDALEAMAREGS